MSRADELIDALGRQHREALQLAEFASLAVRLEPRLLRALRRGLLKTADLSVELDLWHSDLVATRGATAALFHLDVQRALRRRLAAREQAGQALATTLACVDPTSWAARFEIPLNARSMRPGFGEDDLAHAFVPLLDGLRQGGEPGRQAARWVLQASPRWDSRVRASRVAWSAMLASSALLGGRRFADGKPPAGFDQADATRAMPPGLAATRAIGVSMRRRSLRFHAPGERNAETIDVPLTAPPLMLLTPPGESMRVIDALPGRRYDFAHAGAVELRSLLGDGWRLEAGDGDGDAEQAATSYASMRVWAIEVESRPPFLPPSRAIEARAEIRIHGNAPVLAIWPRQGPGTEAPPIEALGLDIAPMLARATDAQAIELDVAPELAHWSPERWSRIGDKLIRAVPGMPSAKRIPTGSSRRRPHRWLQLKLHRRGDIPNGIESPMRNLFSRREPAVEMDVEFAETGSSAREALAKADFTALHIFCDGAAPELLEEIVNEFSQSRAHPELVVVQGNAARAAMLAGTDSVFAEEFFASGAHIVVFSETQGHLESPLTFVQDLLTHLVDGMPLHRAVAKAREMSRKMGSTDYPPARVWGRLDETLSLGRDRLNLQARLETLKASVAPLQFGATDDDPRGNRHQTGIWVGADLLITSDHARSREVRTFDRGAWAMLRPMGKPATHESSGLMAFTERRRSPARRAQLLADVAPFGKRPATLLVANADRVWAIPAMAEGDEERHLQALVEPEDMPFQAADVLAGAVLTLSGACVGIVTRVSRDQSGRMLLYAAPLRTLRDTLRGAWETRLPLVFEEQRRTGLPLDLNYEDLAHVDFRQFAATLDAANLRKSRLDFARLDGMSLNGANLEYAKLLSANLSEARLCGANLRRAMMRSVLARNADLRDADLSYADLSYANLTGANLRGAKLTGTRLRDADLRDARLDPGALAGAVDVSVVYRTTTHFATRTSSKLRPQVFVSMSQVDGGLRSVIEAASESVGLSARLRASASDVPHEVELARLLPLMDAAIVLWSAESAQESWQLMELSRLHVSELPLLPIALEGASIPATLIRLRNVSALRDDSLPRWIDHLAEFAQRVRTMIWSRTIHDAPPSDGLLFCISAAEEDVNDAYTLFKSLLAMGATPNQIWFDIRFDETTPSSNDLLPLAIQHCRVFVPILSFASTHEGIVNPDWRNAFKNNFPPLVVPMIVEPELTEYDLMGDSGQADWRGRHFRAPFGVPDMEADAQLRSLMQRWGVL